MVSRPADLVVTALQAPATAVSGGSIRAGWTVQNFGAGDTVDSTWFDRLVISPDAVLGNGNDTTLATIRHDGLLDPETSYSMVDQLVALPFSLATGNYFLFLTTDSDNRVFEATPAKTTIPLLPCRFLTRRIADLQVTQLTAPATAGGETLRPVDRQNLARTPMRRTGTTMSGSPGGTVLARTTSARRVRRTNALPAGIRHDFRRSFRTARGASGTFFVLVAPTPATESSKAP